MEWNGHVRNGSTLESTEGMKGKFYQLMSLKYLNHLEILTRISKGLPEIVLSFGLWSTNKTWKTIENPI